MLLAVAFILFALMLVSWFVAPSAEKTVVAKDAPVSSPVGAAMQH
ncbi:MAG TPA: hypothetical protein VNP95_10050 [Thermomicrobiales bacterium]|nr:hypothetical protein [Thermomicrobiales bacterium]